MDEWIGYMNQYHMLVIKARIPNGKVNARPSYLSYLGSWISIDLFPSTYQTSPFISKDGRVLPQLAGWHDGSPFLVTRVESLNALNHQLKVSATYIWIIAASYHYC
jgi:hypothetical protein